MLNLSEVTVVVSDTLNERDRADSSSGVAESPLPGVAPYRFYEDMQSPMQGGPTPPPLPHQYAQRGRPVAGARKRPANTKMHGGCAQLQC